MIFSQLKTIPEFRAALATIDDPVDLTEVRDVVRRWNQNTATHALRDPRKGFKHCFAALDQRADELQFIKYSWGYRRPASTTRP